MFRSDCVPIIRRNSRPKRVEICKYTKKNCAQGWLYFQDYTGMLGQQNIKKKKERSLLFTKGHHFYLQKLFLNLCHDEVTSHLSLY